jgi:hypothetical protein
MQRCVRTDPSFYSISIRLSSRVATFYLIRYILQNGKKYTNLQQNYQMALKCANIFKSKALLNLPKLWYLARKYTIWQPCCLGWKSVPLLQNSDWRAHVEVLRSIVIRLGKDSGWGKIQGAWNYNQYRCTSNKSFDELEDFLHMACNRLFYETVEIRNQFFSIFSFKQVNFFI